MAVHTVSDTNPTHVTGADWYRISFTGLLMPKYPQFAVMEEFLLPEHRRPEGYGFAFLESEEHSATYVGPVDQIQEYEAASVDGAAVLDVDQGVMYAFWPHGEGWDKLIPANTWNVGGEGIVAEFDHPLGGKVVVYEYLQPRAGGGERSPMVGFHCERCHPAPHIDHEAGMPNRGPHDRRWSARDARVHVRSHTERCRPVDPRLAEIAQQIANKIHGVNNPVTTWESHCATTGPCAEISRLRARARYQPSG